MALCPLPVRDPKDEKNRVVVPKEGQEPAFEKQEANSTASSVPPGPELKRKKMSTNVLLSIISAVIITFLIWLLLYFLSVQITLIWIIILIIVFVACFILFFATRKRH